MIKKVTINKPGGTASKNAAAMYRITIPAEMVKILGLTPEERSVELEMVGDMLTVRKYKEEK